ncbi:MAG: hypothetical protein SAJ12_21420 [Jaaginema sp. PMC 1079.18]|nr:hypothetical protein [Jaaginema sp. PMC 1080.18]MEC4853548.1 hypothetical protein [Jaaginema sp. PMC 1079.18]MEC4865534.1 hypothetical protein [Jaaginema sp. PMC 1078.18]
MKFRVIADTGPLVAIVSEKDEYHQVCVEAVKNIKLPLFTCWSVITEAQFLLKQDRKAVQNLFEMIEKGAVKLVDLPDDSVIWLKAFLYKYYNSNLQSRRQVELTDASVCYLVESMEINTIFTLDREDFIIYRINKNQPLNQKC